MTDGSHITRLGDVKQEIQDLKPGFESSVNQVKVSIDGKISEINLQLKDIKENFASTLNYIYSYRKYTEGERLYCQGTQRRNY